MSKYHITVIAFSLFLLCAFCNSPKLCGMQKIFAELKSKQTSKAAAQEKSEELFVQSLELFKESYKLEENEITIPKRSSAIECFERLYREQGCKKALAALHLIYFVHYKSLPNVTMPKNVYCMETIRKEGSRAAELYPELRTVFSALAEICKKSTTTGK
jgi:hypothetical protein